MNINRINNSPSFGLNCSPKIKRKILLNLSTDKLPSYFKNTDQLVSNIDNIGSDSTKLCSYNIKRKILDIFDKTEVYGINITSSDEIGVFDRCDMTLKLKNYKGKYEKIKTCIISQDYDYADIYKHFQKSVKFAEKDFILKQVIKLAKRGKLEKDADKLIKIYPKHETYINDMINVYKPIDEITKEYQKKSLSFRIFSFIFD